MRIGGKQWNRLRRTFWLKVDKSAGPDACWPWMTNAKCRGGYGAVNVRRDGGKGRSCVHHASRIAYLLRHNKLLPRSVKVLHKCDNPPCCNPRHLFTGSQLDNIEDMVRKKRDKQFGRGDSHPFVKMTRRRQRKMKRMFATGRYQQKDLAGIFKVSRATASRILGKRRAQSST